MGVEEVEEDRGAKEREEKRGEENILSLLLLSLYTSGER